MNFVTAMIKPLVCLDARRAIRALGATVALLLFTLPLFPQANQGTIQGSVFDQTGGAIAGATVTIMDPARGASRPLTSDSAGAYVAPNLIPGMYTVRGEAKGFQTLERSNVLLEVGQTVRIDLILQPGAQTQTITVTGEAPTVNTSDATLGGTISQETLTSLPMNGRDFKNLLQLRPGVTAYQGGGIDTWSANGTRAEDVGYLIDGLRADEAYTGNSIVNSPMPAGDAATGLPVDAIQEINNQANEKAEVGWKPGAVINVGVKSGTNSLHGTAFAFGRTTSFDARNAFNPPPLPQQSVALEQFGGSAGARIIKDKLFWFADYEGQRYSVDNLSKPNTPITVSLGNCTAASTFPCGDTTNSLVDACLALNHSATAISPLSAQLAGLNTTTCAVAPTNYTPGPTESLYPTKTVAGAAYVLLPSYARQDNGIGKLDYHINDHHSISGMVFVGVGGIISPPAAGLPTASWPFNTNQGATAELVTGSWNWAVSSSRVNEFRLGYSHFDQDYHSVDNTVNPLAYGIDTGVTETRIFGLPSIAITGFASIGGGQHKIVGPNGSTQLLDHFSLVHGNHTFKFGGEFIDNNITSYQNNGGKGVIKFPNLTGFLTGNVNKNGNSIVAGSPARLLSNQQYALFGQDDWRVARRVIVNLGLRWEYSSVLKETNNLIGNFSPTLGLVQVGNQITSPYNPDYRNFSPRVGLAWDIRGNGRTVLRAGTSLMYEYLPIISYVAVGQSLGLTQVPTGDTIFTAGACAAGCAGLTNGIKLVRESVTGAALTPGWQAQTAACVSGGTTACGSIFPASVFKFQCGDGTAGANPCVVAAIDPNIRTPYIETWTLGVQRAITSTLALDVSYVGTHGVRLPGFVDINQAAVGSGFTAGQIAAGDPGAANAAAEQATRPFNAKFPYLSNIDQQSNVDHSDYNSLQVALTQRLWHGLTFLAGYTYGHAFDNSSTNSFTQLPVNSLQPQAMYASSDFDIRNRFTLTTGYALPGIKAPGQMLEGWRINSVVTLQSGSPWNPKDSANDLSGTGEVSNTYYFGSSWNFSGSPSDFTSNSTPLACWSGSSPKNALPGCGTTFAIEPSVCANAAAAISAATTAVTSSVGCFVSANGKAAMFPAALGTFGNAGRNIFRDGGFRNWDLSVTKDWKYRERYDAQFKVEVFNILNHPNFTNPGGIGSGAGFNDPSAGGGGNGSFGCGCVTPDQAAPNPVLGSGSNRAMQLGLKLTF